MKEEIFCSYFLDDRETASRIYELLANDILGIDQLEKIKLRYYDMHRNFFNYSKDEAAKLEKSGQKSGIWEFSKGIEPFMPKGWNRHYEDTITVPIPITHPDFIDLTTRTVKRGAIGLDFPTWFNLKDNDRRIMIISQDPLRGNKWYSDAFFKEGNYVCSDALVASPFGLHDKSWRDKKNGGGRMKALVETLIERGYGIYLTDCRKYYVYDASESAKYSKGKKEIYKTILHKEIDIINPKSIVALGNQAYRYCRELIGDDERLLHMPHFSGLATGSQKKFFEIDEKQKVAVEELAEKYAEYIIRECK